MMYGVPTSQCEPIRSKRSSPLPHNRFLEPEAVIAEGLKGGGKTLPPNTFSIPSRTISGRIRKISQYSVRSEDDDEDDDDAVSYISATEDEDDDDDKEVKRHVKHRHLQVKVPELARSRSENDVSRGIVERSTPSPFLTVPGQDGADGRRLRSPSVKSSPDKSSYDDLRITKRKTSPKTRRKSVPVKATSMQVPTRGDSPTSAGGGVDPVPSIGLAGTALAGVGMMGVGGGHGLETVIVEEEEAHGPQGAVLRDSPSPVVEINVTEDGERIEAEEDSEDEDSDEDASEPPPPPPPPFSPEQVDQMRRVLKFYFMDPIQKWKAKRRFPWKLCLQLLKIVFVTIQLCLFGSQRSAFIVFSNSNKVAFEHLYLKDWDPALEGMPYPPARGPYAVYDVDGFYDRIDFAILAYFNTSSHAVGIYAVHPYLNTKHSIRNSIEYVPTSDSSSVDPPQFCQAFYPHSRVTPENNSYSFPARAHEKCLKINVEQTQGFSIKSELTKANMTIDFQSLINVTIKFKVKTIHLRSLVPLDDLTCYLFDVNILFDNSQHSGQIPTTLALKDHPLRDCTGDTAKNYHEDEVVKCLIITFDVVCVAISLLSFILCSRSVLRAIRLRGRTEDFFLVFRGVSLSPSERMEFINFWYLTIILNDILTIIGSVFKILIETKAFIDWNITGLTLGTSNLLVWVGVLRYLSFFSRYNILIVTLKHAMPDLIRFLVCTLVLFFGFVFCGWTVLGPYNLKFQTIWSTMECLFSLVNGDDMYVTFTASSMQSSLVWYYSQLYLYAFICLFIYVNISLFTAVILDSYSLIKYYYQHGFPKSDLFEFIDECSDPPESPSYRRTSSTNPLQDSSKWVSRPKSRNSNVSSPSMHSGGHHRDAHPRWHQFRDTALVSCFRCCGGIGRNRSRRQGRASGDLPAPSSLPKSFSATRVNSSPSDRQQLVYSDSDDDDQDYPENHYPTRGMTLHM